MLQGEFVLMSAWPPSSEANTMSPAALEAAHNRLRSTLVSQGYSAVEMEGTYSLPEAQRDRFMARVSMGYPIESAEIAMLDSHAGGSPLEDLDAVTDAGELRKLTGIVAGVHVAPALQRYAVALTGATRRSDDLVLGASPRATLHLVRAAKAVAAMDGRDFVLPDDLRALTEPVLAHRLVPSVEASMAGRTTTSVLAALVASVPVPDATSPAGRARA